ncbi:MAG: hypothetical protein Q7W02_12840 [Candidatus Rokubacteria bacterium]|nr:hypothetical protein [Candidatus Rokubacteria bacterium]
MERSFAAGMSLLALLGVGPAPALALTITNQFQFRENRGPNTLGFTPGDQHVVGANTITPSGDGTAAEATQGAVTRLLPFFPSTTLFSTLW